MATKNTTERINFASSKLGTDYPDFLDIQVKSFQDFFQLQTKAGTENLYTFSQKQDADLRITSPSPAVL